MKDKKGIFIVLDGIDGAGKTTQTELLIKRLEQHGYPVSTLDFPQYYHNFFGQMVGDYLNGSFGKIDPKLASILYALDRWESKENIEKELQSGKVFVCNRYASANMIHQGGRIKNTKKRQEMLNWLHKMEFEIFKIPQPDLVIYLDIIPEIGQKLVDKKTVRKYNQGKKRDLHEKDKQHLTDARKNALRLVKKYPNWKKINCLKNKKILSPAVIGEKVWQEVIEVLH